MPTQIELFLEKTMLYISKYCPRQEINFRKMKKKKKKNLTQCLKKYCHPHLHKKIFTRAGDGNEQFFYFGLIATQFSNWFQSSTKYKVQ